MVTSISLITVKSNALLSIACKVNVNKPTAEIVKLLPGVIEALNFKDGGITTKFCKNGFVKKYENRFRRSRCANILSICWKTGCNIV